MVIISKVILRDFSDRHPDVEKALTKWYNDTKKADWKKLTDIKNTFNTVDYVGNDRYVFDIMGNNYRLVALIILRKRTVFILFVGSHKEYDKIDAAKITFRK